MRGNGWPGPLVWPLIALLGGSLWAQTAPEPEDSPRTRLTVEEAVNLAMKNNLSLQAGALALDTKKRKSDLVWNQFLPDLAVRGTLAHQNKASSQSGVAPLTSAQAGALGLSGSAEISIPGGPTIYNYMMPYSMTAPQWHVQGNFSASLTLSAALFAGIQAIQADYQAGQVTYEKASLQIERDVRKAYNDMLLLAENIALLRESYATADRQVVTAQANYRAGLAPELTLLQARVSRDNMKPTIDQAENGLALSEARFAMTLGLPYETRFELVPAEGETGFIPLDLAELIRQATRNKPDIRELQRQLAALEKSRKAQALQSYTPYLRFDWSLNPTFSPALDPFKDNWFKKDNWSDGGTFSITVGIGLNSLFSFTKEGQAIKDIDNQIKTIANGISQAIRGTELEIYNTLLALEQVQTTVEAQTETVKMAEQSYKLTEDAYKAGLQDLLQVQNAELQLRQARLEILKQEFSYRNSLIDLEYAMGIPFGALSSREGGN
ncbi:MAG: TolC family protein [Spirochaetaceae bacterium]|nr:TolC family protein [Spirochaetaceae bacterium]